MLALHLRRACAVRPETDEQHDERFYTHQQIYHFRGLANSVDIHPRPPGS